MHIFLSGRVESWVLVLAVVFLTALLWAAAPQPGGAVKPKLRAYWVSRDTIVLPEAPAEGASVWLQPGDRGQDTPRAVQLLAAPAGLAAPLKSKFPHLAALPVYRVPRERREEVAAWLKGPVGVAVRSGGRQLTYYGLQTAGVLDDLYCCPGRLGVIFSSGVPTLKLWAPTARSVRLRLYDDFQEDSPERTFSLSEDPSSGVWSVIGEPDWNRRFYLYEIEVYSPMSGRVERNLVTDPYSLSLSADGKRSQIVRLDDPDLQPDGWSSLRKPPLEAPEDIAIYELHVRDFSISDPTVPERLRGTFGALAAGSNGRRHLEELARAGMTHVHLLPVFDFFTVPEIRSQQKVPEGDLSAWPPDSEKQQEAVAKVQGKDGYNWGYDPHHYTVPEGSYSTDPNGPARIREFREMVQALNGIGLRVVMDVVYNHTHAAGQEEGSALDRIVPAYYHRLDADGAVANSTCCANTASEHAMMEKLMLDSVLTWARDYKVDGFRFDLMGHHMKSNMIKIREALDALTPASDGIDGRQIYVYGEGWDFGEVAKNARGVNATQGNLAGTGIGTFNDRARDGVRGGTPFSDPRDQGFATGLHTDSNGSRQGDERSSLLRSTDWIRLGLAGNLADYRLEDAEGRQVFGREIDYLGSPAGYASDPQENIFYVSAHDNETLFDAIQMKAASSASLADRVRIQNLAISITALAQGIPFFHAGVDMLRSKSLDRDSFNSGDWFNRLDFSYGSNNWGVGLPPAEKNRDHWPLMKPLLANPALKPAHEDILRSVHHLREMLRIRRSAPLFRLRTASQIHSRVRFLNTGPSQIAGLIVLLLGEAGENSVVVLFNARKQPVTFAAPQLRGADLRLHPVQRESYDPVVRQSSFDSRQGSFQVPARTAAVFLKERPGD